MERIICDSTYALYLLGAIVGFPALIFFSAVRSIYRCLKWKRKSIDGEVALITGAGRGFGRDLAVVLAKLGCQIAIVDIQGKLAQETADHIAKTYGVKTKAYKVDVSNFQQLELLRAEVTKDLGHVTILINNAGILMMSSADNPPPQEVQNMVNVNLMATLYTTQIFLPKMKELNRGHVVNVSSMSVMLPNPLYGVYSATKAAVRQFTSCLRVELMMSGSKVKATTVIPTFISTNERTDLLMKLTNGSKLLPGISGDVVAQSVVNAMLRGDDEVVIPRVFGYCHRLMSLFSLYFIETNIANITRGIWSKRNKREVQDILDASRIPTDS